MTTLFPDESVRAEKHTDVWKRKEVDRLLDLYLSGKDPGHIAVVLQRGRKGVQRKLQEYIYNERDRAMNYRPRHRYSRAKKRITANEIQIIKTLQSKNVPEEKIAAILQRPKGEVTAELLAPTQAQEKPAMKQLRQVAASLDLIWALRYSYFVYKRPLVSDATYDILVQEEIEFGGLARYLEVKNYQGWPLHIKSLALYILDKAEFERKSPLKEK